MAPAVTILPLPDMTSVRRADDERGVDAVHGVGVAGLADADDAAVADADVGLDDAPVVEDHRAGDHQVGRALGAGRGRLAHRLADDLAAAEHHLVAAGAAVLGDLDQQVGVGQPDAVAGGGPVEGGVAGSLDAHQASQPSSGPATSPRRPATILRPAMSTRSTSRSMPGSKRTEVPAGMARRVPRAAARSNASAGLASAKW